MNKWINIIALFSNYSNLKFLLKYLGTFLPDCALFPIQKLISFSFLNFEPEDQDKASDCSNNLISAIKSFFFNFISWTPLPFCKVGRLSILNINNFPDLLVIAIYCLLIFKTLNKISEFFKLKSFLPFFWFEINELVSAINPFPFKEVTKQFLFSPGTNAPTNFSLDSVSIK